MRALVLYSKGESAKGAPAASSTLVAARAALALILSLSLSLYPSDPNLRDSVAHEVLQRPEAQR